MKLNALLVTAALATGALSPAAQAETLRWAAQNDILTLDPHSQNHATTNAILMHVVRGPDALQREVRGRARAGHEVDDDQPDPGALRTAQGREIPRRHAVHRRRRGLLASAASSSRRARCGIYVSGIAEIKKIDDHTVDFMLSGPNAAAAAQHHRLPHHEQGVVGEEPHHQRAGLQGQGRQLRVAQRERHRRRTGSPAGRPTSASR